MARKKVIDLNADSTIKFGSKKGALPKGSEFAGYYVGSKEVTTRLGPSQLHVFQTSDGSVGVWGSAQLNAKLNGLKGLMTFIKFTGEVSVPNGTMKVFEVEYDDEDTIDVGGTQVNFRDAQEPDSEEQAEEEEEQEEEQADEEEEAEEEQAPAKRPPAAARSNPTASVTSKPKASMPSAEAQARTAALLRGNKK